MKKEFWGGEKVLITGGLGFLGTHLISKLERLTKEIFAFSSQEYDLREEEQVKKLFRRTNPNITIHLAAKLGNLEYLKKNPIEIYNDNLRMNSLVLKYSRRQMVKKFTGIGTAFSYPEGIKIPFEEENFWDGEVEKDSSPYSLSKKEMLVQSQNYRRQFNLNAIHLVLTSLYGPGAKNSSAVLSIIKKFGNAIKNKEGCVEFWGTGNATRDLLYVKDAADAIILATESYDKEGPINIGSGREIKIKTLVEKLGELMNFDGEILWDPTKPEGPKRVFLDSSKAKKEFDFEAKTSLEEGLKETINYFQSLDDLNS